MTHVGNRGGGNGGLRPHLEEAAAVESSPKGDSGSGLDLSRRRRHGGGFIPSYRRGGYMTGKRKTQIEGLGYTVQGLNGPNTLLGRIQSQPRRTGYTYPATPVSVSGTHRIWDTQPPGCIRAGERTSAGNKICDSFDRSAQR
jgi:hypothetical protein